MLRLRLKGLVSGDDTGGVFRVSPEDLHPEKGGWKW
jgi:hypothetical protein